MEDRSFLTLIKYLFIGALIIVMALGGTVAITPRDIFWGYSDVCCRDAGAGYDWLGLLIVVPFVVGVALVTAVLKLWIKDRVTKTTHR
jgi:hypothetical protein